VAPPLLVERPPALQFVLVVLVPTIFGIVTGLVLGISEAGYLILSLLGIGGGYFAGLEHNGAAEGALRGLAGGLLFGTFILVGKEVSGAEPKAHLPDPELLLVPIITVIGIGLGALGGNRRARRERREPQSKLPTEA
jgi:hypothetical protein